MTSEVTENKTSDETERNELNENKDVGENEQSSPIKKKNNSVQHGHQRTASMDFKEMTRRDALGSLSTELDKLSKTCPQGRKEMIDREFDGFKKLFGKFINEKGPSVFWDQIERLPPNAILPYSSLNQPEDVSSIRSMLDQLVVIKLNGGLGTSMGCSGPKSVIPVRSELTFLDLTVQQIEYLNKKYDANVPLVLMNSFNTDEDTMKIIRKYAGFNICIRTFNQSCYPRISKETMAPVARSCSISDDIESWYPPGHGDFYQSFHNSGLLDEFVKQGKKYCFISNIDNLGATVDLNILNMVISKNREFVMEVTDKTRADVKGGTLIQYEGHLRLLEAAQVPKEHEEDFKSVKKFNVFNTNNLWINLPAIQRVLSENTLDMEIIVNPKQLAGGVNVIQLETAVGAAMKCFEQASGVNVPRSRFLPVKKTSDLLLVMSNLYSLDHGALTMSPMRMFPATPLVKLGDTHFKKVSAFLSRFGSIPDLLELDHLTVSGDVTFGRGVSLRGTVIIIANHGDRIDIPAGAILENKIVSGNLRILDH